MTSSSTRRNFLTTMAGGAIAGTEGLAWLAQVPRVSAAELQFDSNIVRLRPEIEPLVRLIEETPRQKLLEEVGARIRSGTTYPEVLAALQLAGVRNVQPRPSVGFKFHAVLVVNSAHLASLSSPESDRWLPIFWALDNFKTSQARDVEEGNWTMSPVDEAAVPPPDKAREAFIDAMRKWDVSAADAAVAGLVRSTEPDEMFELFSQFGARDFRSIGHKAIFVANSWRTLEVIGWQHAEPVLRSLAYALLNHQGEPNPAQSDLGPDRPGKRNAELARKLRDDWQQGQVDSAATTELLANLREGSPDESCDQVVELLNGGISPRSVYDALLVGSGELLMRQPGIVGLHAVTTTNALHYLFHASQSDETRRQLILQNAAFLPLFREAMRGRGAVGDVRLDTLEPVAIGAADQPLDEIFRDVSGNRTQAAGKVLTYAQDAEQAQSLITAARRLIFMKGRDSHDYKFSSAALEDYFHVSPEWRGRFLASSVFNLKGSEDRDNPLVERTRQALSV